MGIEEIEGKRWEKCRINITVIPTSVPAANQCLLEKTVAKLEN